MIGIIDYDAGNIRSVEKAMKYLGQDVCITRDRDTLLRADKVSCREWDRLETL